MLSLVKFSRSIPRGCQKGLSFSRCRVLAREQVQVLFSTTTLLSSETSSPLTVDSDDGGVGGVPMPPVTKKKIGYVDVDGMSQRDKEFPGLFYLNTLNLPPVLKDNLTNYLKEFPRKVLESDGTKLARHLKNRGRPTARTWKKYKESKRSRKEKEREKFEAQLRGNKPVRLIRMSDLDEEDDNQDDDLKRMEGREDDDENDEIDEIDDEVDDDLSKNELDDVESDENDDLSEKAEIVEENDKQEKKDEKKKAAIPTSPRFSEYKVVRYNKRETAAFASSRIPACYGSTLRVFHEIARREPDFKPETMLDFGSGVGSTVWAGHERWGSSLKEYQCVDISEDMNRTAELLLRGGTSLRKPLHIPGVYFKRFLPVSNRITYDIVVASYSLSELPFARLRKAALLNLWRKADRFLVIIEYGNNEGFEVTLEARNLVVKNEHEFPVEEPEDIPNIDLGPEDDDEIPSGHVFAPCPHDVSCERSDVETRHKPCSFEQRVQLAFAQENSPLKKWSHAKESFSYIVLEKGQRSENEDAWPRILEPIKKRKRHVITRLCCGSGSIEQRTLTLRKDSDIYKCARHCSSWGDLLPSPESRIRPVKPGPKIKKERHWETRRRKKKEREAMMTTGEDENNAQGSDKSMFVESFQNSEI